MRPGVHDGGRRQQALDELVAAHLQAEDRRPPGSWLRAACSAMPRASAVLPMLGRAATTIMLPGLEPADDAVEVDEPGRRRPTTPPPASSAAVSRSMPLDHQLVGAGEVAAHALLRQLVDERLGVLEHRGGLALALGDHRARSRWPTPQQPPLGRRVAHDLRVGAVAGRDERRLHQVEHGARGRRRRPARRSW